VAEAGAETIWSELRTEILSAKAKIDDHWKVKVKESEQRVSTLRAEIEEAEKLSIHWKKQWHQELRKNQELWSRYESLQAQLDNLSKPLKNRLSKKA
jgi:DNA repair exonuclease SbcCD ATPase subunit